MANNEQLGITIKFRGESVEFSNDVKGVDNAIKLLQKDAKNLNKELKLDPKNSEALQEYFTNLKQQAKLLTQQIETYKKAIEDVPEIKTADDARKLADLNQHLADCEVRLAKVNEQIKLFNVQDIKQLGQDFSNLGKTLGSISNVLNTVGRAFAGLSTASAGALAVGLKYNATLEQNTIALTTALGDEAEALKTIKNIQQDAQSTPWSVSELIDYNRVLISTGLSAEESEKIILSLGDAISATGGTSDVFSRMVSNLQQIKNAGSATAMDIRQFAYAGIDIYGILSEYLGKTTDQITEQDRTWENIIGAFKKASSVGGKYFGAMENQSTTLTAQISKLKDEFEQALGSITESLMPTIENLVSKVKSIATWLKELDPSTQELIGNILVVTASIAPLLLGLGGIIGKLSGLSTAIGSFLQNTDFLKWFSTLRTSVSEAGGVINLFKAGLSSTIGVIALVVAAFVLMYTQSESFRNAINNLVVEIGEFFMPILTNLKTVFMSLWNILTEVLIPAFLSLFETLGNILAPVINVISDIFESRLNPLCEALANLVGQVLVLAFNSIRAGIELTIVVVKSIVEWIVKLYNKFKETQAFETFKNAFNACKEAIDLVIGVVASLINWVSDAIGKLNELFSFNGKSVDVGVNTNARGVTQLDSGGYGSAGYGSGGYASGGYNFTINVTNSGGTLNATTIKHWASMLTNQINENLGKEM